MATKQLVMIRNIPVQGVVIPNNPRYESGRAALTPITPRRARSAYSAMKTTFLLCLVLAGTVRAQNPLTTAATQRYFNVVRRNLEASADVMPAEKYGFRLTEGQMTFAEWLIHSAQRNYSDCA